MLFILAFIFICKFYSHLYLFYMSSGQNYLLPAMDIAKVGGPLSVVKVCTCENRVSVSGWFPIGYEGFRTKLKSEVHPLLL